MSAPAVLCFGLAALDRIYELAALPAGEGKHAATAYRESGGGIAATAAVAIARLGGAAHYAGALGEDTGGDWLAAEMAALGVCLAHLARIPGGRSPSAVALVAPDGARCLAVDRGTAHPAPPDPRAGFAAVLVDHRFPAESATVLRAAPPGVPSVLDAEGHDAARLHLLAPLATHPVFSAPGLALCTGTEDPEEGLRRVDAPEARAVGVTLGAAGSLWRNADGLHRVPAPRVVARDTTGCGDVFHGAFALALAEGAALLDAARFATAAAALKAEAGNGWRGMPERPQVAALLRGGW